MSGRRVLLHRIDRSDLRLDWFSGTGAGGQHRNKHQNCLRLTHAPTGVTVVAQDHRERSRNLRDGLRRLAEALRPWIRDQIGETPLPPRSDEVVRSLNLATNRATDVASGEKWSADGFDLDTAMKARRAALARSKT